MTRSLHCHIVKLPDKVFGVSIAYHKVHRPVSVHAPPGYSQIDQKPSPIKSSLGFTQRPCWPCSSELTSVFKDLLNPIFHENVARSRVVGNGAAVADEKLMFYRPSKLSTEDVSAPKHEITDLILLVVSPNDHDISIISSVEAAWHG